MWFVTVRDDPVCDALSRKDPAKRSPVYFSRTCLDSAFAPGQRNIEMLPIRPGILQPGTGKADLIRHGEKLFGRIGQHMAHEHATIRSSHVVDIDHG